MVVGLVMLPNLRVGKPTPVNDKTRKKREELWFIFWKKYVALNHVWIFYGDIIIITWAVRKKNGGVGLWLSSKWQALICTCLQSKLCDTKQEQWPGSLYWQHRSCALYLTFWKTNTLRSVVLLSSTGFAVGGKKKRCRKSGFHSSLSQCDLVSERVKEIPCQLAWKHRRLTVCAYTTTKM